VTRRPSRTRSRARPSAPGAAAPAGPVLELQIGAVALAALLAGSPPRGFPGLSTRTVTFQRAGMGSPLDDVVVEGALSDGRNAKIEIQAKRSLDFTASDEAWRDVVGQIAESARQQGVDPAGLERAVAIARSSTRIDREYQQVLSWAREHEDSTAFFGRLDTPHMATDVMRTFVAVFRANLASAGFANDADTSWRLLRCFQIHAYDFEAPGSLALQLVHQQLAAVLPVTAAVGPEGLWATLLLIAAGLDTRGGGITREGLVRRLLEEHAIVLSHAPALGPTRARLAELADGVLSQIVDKVGGVHLVRSHLLSEIDAAFDGSRVVELSGGGGVGKSGVAKAYVERVRRQGDVVCLNEARTPAGGWLALQNQLACPVTLVSLLGDLASTGGDLLVIDGVDRVLDLGKQQTLRDLIAGALATPGMRILLTARNDFVGEARTWLDRATAAAAVAEVRVRPLDDAEAVTLASETPALMLLLRADHPAAALSRNLFQLSRLLRAADRDDAIPDSEAALAALWWDRGGGADTQDRNGRLRLLRRAVTDSFTGSADIRFLADEDAPVAQLVSAESMVEIVPGERGRFAHDVLRDWAVAGAVGEDLHRLDAMPLSRPISVLHARGVELAARRLLETGALDLWDELLGRLTSAGVHPTWRRVALLALTRSERVMWVLGAARERLLANDCTMLLDLIRLTRTIDARPLSDVLEAMGRPTPPVARQVMTPNGGGWVALVVFLIANEDVLPATMADEVADLLIPLMSIFGADTPFVAQLAAFTFRWLWRLEGRDDPGSDRVFRRRGTITEKLRMVFLATCGSMPELADRLVRAYLADGRRRQADDTLLAMPGAAPRAAPAAWADYVHAALAGGADDGDEGADRPRPRGLWREPFLLRDGDWMPPAPSRGGILDLLSASPSHGLSLVQRLVDHFVRKTPSGRERWITVDWPDGSQKFTHLGTYLAPRGATSAYVLASIMMALEAWGHQRIEAGDAVEDVVRDVVGQGDQPACRLSVGVDLVLSHWPAAIHMAAPLLGSPEVLAMDGDRANQDRSGIFGFFGNVRQPPATAGVTAADLTARPSRQTSLQEHFGDLHTVGDPLLTDVRTRLEAIAAARSSSSVEDDPDPVRRALDLGIAMLDIGNWVSARLQFADGTVEEGLRFQEPGAIAAALAPKREEASRALHELTLRIYLEHLLKGSEPVTAENAAAALSWARGVEVSPPSEGEDFGDQETRKAALMAAAVTLRDRDPPPEDIAWARATLHEAVHWPPGDDVVRSINGAVEYNPTAIAAVGLIGDVARARPDASLDVLFTLAARPERAIVTAFASAMSKLSARDPALPRVLLGLGLTGSLYALIPRRDDFLTDRDTSRATTAAQRARAVRTAQAWRFGDPAPDLPDLPLNGRLRTRRPRRRPRPPEVSPQRPRAEWSVSDNLAGAWLDAVAYETGPETEDLLARYWPYTRYANGGDATDDDPDLLEGVADAPNMWNSTYFDILALTMTQEGNEAALARLAPILALPDGAFLTCVEVFLMHWDRYWVQRTEAPDEATYRAVRQALAERFVTMRAMSWVRHRRERTLEVALSGGVQAFAAHLRMIGLRFPAGEPRTAAMIPSLALLGLSAPQSGYIAEFIMLLLRDLHDPSLVPVVAELAQAWLEVGDDVAFWSTWGVGASLTTWVLGVAEVAGGTNALRASAAPLSQVLDALVRLGIPNAAGAERLVLESGA